MASISSTHLKHDAGGVDQHPHHRSPKFDDLEAFVTSTLGKGVCSGQPPIIANRVGIAGRLATMKERWKNLVYDVVDDLTGKKLGRASSGTFRTVDVVGLTP
jgi:3-hydroxyacyl-CoA dehydrogenase